MKAKLIPALLLSFVMVSGAVTINDAYAQTNTERLATVDETTMDTNNMIAALNTAITNMTTSIMDMLSEMMSSMDALSASVAGVSTTVDDVSTTVESIDSKVDGLANNMASSSGAVTDVANAVSALSSDVADINEHVHEYAENSADITNAVNDINTEVGNIAASLAASTSGLSGLPASVASIQDTVSDIASSNQDAEITLRLNALEESLNTRLGSLESNMAQISDALNIVQDAVQPVVAPLPEVEETKISGFIYTADYAGAVAAKPDDNIYNYDFTLECLSGAFVTGIEVKTTNAREEMRDNRKDLNDVINDDDADQVLQQTANRLYYNHMTMWDDGPLTVTNPFDTDSHHSKIYADGRVLIDTRFLIGDDKPVIYNQPIKFNFQELSAGDALNIRTELDASPLQSDIKVNAPPPDNENKIDQGDVYIFDFEKLTDDNPDVVNFWSIPLFKVTVTLLSAGDPSCSLSLPEVVGDRFTDRDNTILLNAPTEGPEEALLKDFSVMVDCNDMPTRIQQNSDITFDFIGTVGDVFDSVNTLNLMAGGKNVEYNINSEKTLTPTTNSDTLPIKWDSGMLVVSGSIPTDGALIEITYDTVAGNSCTQVTEEDQ